MYTKRVTQYINCRNKTKSKIHIQTYITMNETENKIK